MIIIIGSDDSIIILIVIFRLRTRVRSLNYLWYSYTVFAFTLQKMCMTVQSDLVIIVITECEQWSV